MKSLKWWPVWGLTKRLTERKRYATEQTVETKVKIFRKSLHIYPIDVGNSNDLNFDIRALQAPQYNIHRFGIFFADVPRHADVLLVLGRPTEKMVPVLMETINQMPEPFSIVVVENGEDPTRGRSQTNVDIENLNLPNVVAHLTKYREPGELIALFLKIKGGAN
jgi:Ni,Fe-hydrogenase III small subunit